MFFTRTVSKSAILMVACVLLLLLSTEATAQIQIGDDIQVMKATPLQSGTKTLATVPEGTVLTAKKLHGKFVLVTIDSKGQRLTGWISVQNVLVMPPEETTLPKDQPKTSSDDAKTTEKAKMPKPASFTLAEVQPLIDKSRKATAMSGEVLKKIPEGWSKCQLDPNKLVDVFKTLSLKKGLTLKAYQFKEGGNGNAVVWALPTGASFPDPNTLITDAHQLFKPPKPTKAYDNYMEAIQGNRSAKSFLEASLLNRELQEMGALWHGSNWGTHTVLGEDPFNPNPAIKPKWAFDGPMAPAAQWKWLKPKPKSWAPTVSVKGDTVTVTFYTYSPMQEEAIYRHVDEYRPGEYRFTTEKTKIAKGKGGIAF